jgi:glyoxylase-like metal-dependent hydrolase (beta-lactamase superfamily II)
MPDQTPTVYLDPHSPPPVVTGRPDEIAEGVFVVPDGRVPLVPNVGVIVGTRAALVIDVGLGPRSGSRVHDMARELAGDRLLLVTLTHFHPEHGFGVQAFDDGTIVYNRAQHEEFREKAAGYLDNFRGLGDAVAHELEDVEFVNPHIVYDGAVDLDLGGKLVQLRQRGPAHTRGDQSIFLPDDGILFTGDLSENRFLPIVPFFAPYDVDVDGSQWMRVLDELKGLDPQTVVPGHGELAGPGLLTTTSEYLAMLKSETERLADEGQDADTIIARLTPQIVDRYPSWDTSETWRIALGIQSFLVGR